MNFTFTATSEPACKNFLKMKKDDKYYSIDEFINKYRSDSEDVLNNCLIWYRDTEMSYKQMVGDYAAFSESLNFYDFKEPLLVLDSNIQAAIYFAKKARDCLHTARYFAMKSDLLLDTNFNLHWSQGYIPQFWFRCINFGTTSTWYSNCFDHILQIAYWGLALYTAVVDRDGNVYDDTWDAKKTMGLCTYEFVVGELKSRGLLDIRKHLTSCSGKIEEVRMWANYIKHKGGIEYKYLEAEKPFKVYFKPVEKDHSTLPFSQIGDKFVEPDESFLIDDFKSPIEIDIDENISKLKDAHIVIHQCLSEVVKFVDFDKHSVKFFNKEEPPQ